MAITLKIGQFELVERIGRGGMGEVWRGHHATQRVPVAVKVLTVERARNDQSINAFRNEVHAMARLNHPGVVRIFDTGIVPRRVEEASFGALVGGSPTVTMELATHGTLDVLKRSLNWNRLKTVLFGVLDALSHAHARGVIHRDLKPGNILVTLIDRQPQIKLADFGLAHATGGDLGLERVKTSGTPRYMAPEQVEGRIRDQGPWTDLYALGCVIYYLLNGRPPFSGTVEEVLSAQLYAELPELEPKFEVPDGFHAWIQKLMAKKRGDRFTRAADAAYELFRLEPESKGLEETFSDIWDDIPNERNSNSVFELEETILDVDLPKFSSFSLDTFHRTIADIPAVETDPTDSEPIGSPIATPLPLDWRRPTIDRPSPKLIGAGLALYGLRPIPFVGREVERDVLWTTLRDVRRKRSMQFVEIRGAMGAGKSRLAEWFSQRAHEVGGATPMFVTHNETPAPMDGLVPAFRRALNCDDLSSEKTFERIRSLFFRTGGIATRDLHDCVAIAELFSEGASTKIQFNAPAERFVLLRRLLRRMAFERPVLFVIDDSQWGLEALEFVEHLGNQKSFPLMIVATVRDEASRLGVQGRVRVKRILQNDWAHSIGISVLVSKEHRRLVAQLLPLSKELETVIVERTAGNPLFAVQLIGDWVQRDILHVVEDGFAIRDGSSVFLPDSMHEVWVERIEQLRQEFPNVADALHVAAILGLEIEGSEWRGAAKNLGVPIADDLVIHLVQQRLAVPKPTGWAFTHAMFRESLLRQTFENDQAPDVHFAVATMLEAQDDDDLKHQLRVADHWIGADRLPRATPLYLSVAKAQERTSSFADCLRSLDKHDEVLSELETPFEDPQWATSLRLRGTCLLRQGDVAGAKDTIDYALEMSQHEGWESERAEFLLLEASLFRKRGDSDGAIAKYQEAYAMFGQDLGGHGRCVYGVGEMLLYKGQVDEAIEKLREAVELMANFDSERSGVAITGLASALIRKGDYDGAREQLERAIDLFSESGNRSGRAAAHNMLGELERSRKNWDAAVVAYVHALEILESVGSWTTAVPRLNLALIHIARKEFFEARVLLEDGVRELARAGEIAHLGFANIALCVAHAGEDDWPQFTRALHHGREYLLESGWHDVEIAHHAELAAQICQNGGQKGLAADCYEVAERQFLGMDMETDAVRVREVISTLFV